MALSLLLSLALTPCLKGDLSCTEKIEAQDRFVRVYRNFSIAAGQPQARRAIVMVHGASRNANDYFLTAVSSALVAGRLDDTLVIAPHYKSATGGCSDPVEPNEAFWDCQSWKSGELAEKNGPSSFAYLDRLVELLNDKAKFPALESIVIAGHSAGGQVLNRYAAMSAAETSSRLPVHYVVANPSSYVYLDNRRLPIRAACDLDGKCTAEFRRFWDGENCTTYNTWRYGLEKKTGYAAGVSDDNIRKNLTSRRITFIVGEVDILPDTDLDMSCAAMAQGANRKMRGLNYGAYLQLFGAKHPVKVPRGCGHSATCIFASPAGAAVLFGK